MNPIYKTGWGQYVDLSKVVAIEERCLFAPEWGWREAFVFIHFYGKTIKRRFIGDFLDQASKSRMEEMFRSGEINSGPRDFLTRSKESFGDIRQKIDSLLTAWQNYHNP